MSHTIRGAHIFSTGTHNGLDFTASDLDGIVAAFNRLSQAGRVPLKFGHTGGDARDGAPALGWVSRLWREGTKLLADFSDVPAVVFDAIKSALYKFTSIELLRDAQTEEGTVPLVLDAVALLGADPPAVRDLADLQRLTAARRMPALAFASRATFTAEADVRIPEGTRAKLASEAATLAEMERLRAEVARLRAAREDFERREGERSALAHRDGLRELLETAVRQKKITPAARGTFEKHLRLANAKECLAFTRADANALIAAADQSRLLPLLSLSFALEDEDKRGVRGMREDTRSPTDLVMKRVRELSAGRPDLIFAALTDAMAIDAEVRETMSGMVGEYLAFSRGAQAMRI